MEKRKKIIIGVGIALCLILLIGIGINAWVKTQLPKLLNKQSDAYAITYKDIDIAVLSGSVDITDATIVPRATLNDTANKAGIYAKVQKIQIRNFKILSVLFSDHISARSLTLNSPQITLYKKNNDAPSRDNAKENVIQPFEKIISVSDFFVYNGDFKIMAAQKGQPVLSVTNVRLAIDGITVTEAQLNSKIPFGYEKYRFSCDSVYYSAGRFYDIITRKIESTSEDLDIADFRMVPKHSRREFVKMVATEKDQFNLSAQNITLKNLDWGYKGDDLFVRTKLATINNCHADIYRNKLPADDLTKKYLYNKLLRDLDFELQVDTLKIKNSLVVYEEEKSFDKGSCKIVFNRFNLTATNLCSGFHRKKADDLKIRIQCMFQDTSPLDVNWSLNIMDKTDGFAIMGTVRHFNVEKIDPFLKPYMNASAKGILDRVHFNFKGNDRHSWGQFAIQYDDLKLKIYKKDDRSKVNKLLTAVGNLLVKNDSNGQVKNAEVSLERIPEKSFYNLLWRSVAEGLKKTLI